MSGAQQVTFMNQRSFVEPAPTVIGQAYGGGFYAGQISTTANGVATHYLVIGPLSTAQNASKQWKTSNTETTGTDSLIDGPTNSSNMNNASHPAAQFCEGLTIGGYSDWYMPAKDELDVCYYNLKPTTTSNAAGAGVNIYAVPRRDSTWTSGTPAQTSAAAFQSGGAQAFAADFYWSSTQRNVALDTAWRISFDNGVPNSDSKTTSLRVRAVRRVPV